MPLIDFPMSGSWRLRKTQPLAAARRNRTVCSILAASARLRSGSVPLVKPSRSWSSTPPKAATSSGVTSSTGT
jgi:hypothetical protein